MILEDTLDFHAQDTARNVWYFGEVVINYEYDDEGNFIGTNAEGAWLADDPGSEPGIIMRGDPAFGAATYEEFAPGVAEDESIIASLSESADTALGHFDDIVMTINTSSLSPIGVETKLYASGVGVIADTDIAPDGEVTASSSIYRRSTVGRVDADDGDDTTLSLTGLREGRAVAHVAEVRDLDPATFAGDGSQKQVTFVQQNTESANALGAYLFDSATGEIGEARILVADLSEAKGGDTVTVDVPAGMTLGLFLVARSDEIGIDLADYTAGGLEIRNMLTGGAANVSDGLAPVVTDAAGNFLPVQPLNALGANDGTNYLNPAAGLHAVGLVSAALAGQDATLVGFEESRSTDPSRDGDFNDAVVAVSAAPLSAATLARLAQEARGVVFGTAAGDDIQGTPLADRIKGLGGNDDIDGAAGNDRLCGGAGADKLDGGRGMDRLIGGGGYDRLEGGAGADEFRFEGKGTGADRILDFARADLVVLHGYAEGFADFDSTGDGRLTGADDAVTRAGGALMLDLGHGDTIAFDGVRGASRFGVRVHLDRACVGW